MKTKILGVAALAVFVFAVMVGTGSLNTAQQKDCQLEKLKDSQGNTFSSLEEFRSKWIENSDIPWQKVEAEYDFEMKNGALHVKSCTVGENQSGGGLLGGLI